MIAMSHMLHENVLTGERLGLRLVYTLVSNGTRIWASSGTRPRITLVPTRRTRTFPSFSGGSTASASAICGGSETELGDLRLQDA